MTNDKHEKKNFKIYTCNCVYTCIKDQYIENIYVYTRFM